MRYLPNSVSSERALTIVLVGQPELAERISRFPSRCRAPGRRDSSTGVRVYANAQLFMLPTHYNQTLYPGM
jgi:hypothetical protein